MIAIVAGLTVTLVSMTWAGVWLADRIHRRHEESLDRYEDEKAERRALARLLELARRQE